MKNIIFFGLVMACLSSCGKDKKSTSDRDIILNDTITTETGLKYVFLKEGTGKKIETGSKVKAFTTLYLNDNPDAFWTTSGEKDSVFGFIHGKTKLIDGFAELNNYLVEGDKVIAILPDSIAYGKEGRNGVPGGATLIYNPYEVRYVSQPKELLGDTLYDIASTKNAKAAIDFYDTILNSDLKHQYHTDIEDLAETVLNLNRDSLYLESELLADHFLSITQDNDMQQSFSFYKLLALEAQNKFKEALELVEPLSQQPTNQEWWHNKTNELKARLSENTTN